MTGLQTIQQQMLAAVLATKTQAVPSIHGDVKADANSRLAIYRHGYRVRLRDALKHEFAGLGCMIGRGFDTLLDAYVEACPSAHYNIRWHGAGLPGFLEKTRHDQPQLAEMARLDWAISTAFDAPDEPSIDVAQLAAVPPDAWATLRLRLHANLQWFACTGNIDAFRRAADRGDARPHLRRHARPRWILIWRHACSVHYRRLDDDEWPVLEAARRGEPFAALCALMSERHGEAAAVARMATLLQTWVHAGFLRGLALGGV